MLEQLKRKFRFLLSPWAILSGMIAGLIVGIYYKSALPYVSPIGRVYISLLNMCIIPIMASAIVVSISKLFRMEASGKYITKILTVFATFCVSIAVVGVLIGLVSIPLIGNDNSMKTAVGKIMLSGSSEKEIKQFREMTLSVKEIDTRFEPEKEEKHRIGEFMINMIPDNIFNALSDDAKLKIVIFFIVLGVMMKFVKEEHNRYIVGSFEGIFEAFQKLIQLAMYFLPLGLFALMADQFAEVGFGVLLTLIKLIVLILFSSLVVFFLSTVIIWKKMNQPYFRQFLALKDAILVTLGTRSSFAALPLAITGMVDNLKFEKDKTSLSISLGLTLCKHGKTMLFCTAAVFAANLYDYKLGFASVMIIIISSILAGMAASGAPSIVSRGMISMVLAPLGIPDGAIIAILLTIDPVVDPIITLVSTYPNYAAAALIATD